MFQECSDIFENFSHVFSKNSDVFVRISHVFVQMWDIFGAVPREEEKRKESAFFCLRFWVKIVLIFRFSVKVVKAKSAKVQGCARVSPAREKTIAVRTSLGRHTMRRSK